MTDAIIISPTTPADIVTGRHDADAAALATARPELGEATAHFAARSRSASTLRTYRSAVAAFRAWCDAHGVAHFPASPRSVAGYLTDLAIEGGPRSAGGASASTVQVAAAAIRWHHSEGARAMAARGMDASAVQDPTSAVAVREVLAGLTREIGKVKRKRRAAPARAADIRAMVAARPGSDPLAVRDRAVLLLGFAGALRRSEIAALDVNDVEIAPEGLRVTVRQSKKDQQAKGATVGVPRGTGDACPVEALRAWLALVDATDGPLFRVVTRGGIVTDKRMSGRAVARMVKRLAELAGLDPERFSGHSLRRGLATSATEAGRSTLALQRQGRWASADMPALYASEASIFADNAAAGLL